MHSHLSVRLLLPVLALTALAACNNSEPKLFTVISDAFEAGGRIPQIYSCDGDNQRPPLRIQNLPKGTESIAIIMEDPDATSGLFTHWTVWNIDPKLTIIPHDDPLAGAVEGLNGKNAFGYIAPCPLSDTHRYVFRVFAVNRQLSIPSTTTPDQLKKELADYVISQTEITGLYARTSGGTDASTASGTKTLPGSTITP